MGESCTAVYGSKCAEYYLIIHVSHKCDLMLKPGGGRERERGWGWGGTLKATAQSKAAARKDAAGSQLSL